MPIEFDIPQESHSIIKVIGVGGGGSNAVSHMFNQGIVGVDFAISNTDNQSMEASPVPVKIQLGPLLTEGRGAGSIPSVGKQACLESIEDVRNFLEHQTKMLFITAGMGGGTGTGAAPIIAQTARDLGILTVGIVTIPFSFEGQKRQAYAAEGIQEMKECVDALIIISNDKLREIHGDLVLSEAFSKADDILTTAAKGIAEIITLPGNVNVDFEDVNTVMRNGGVAIMGTAKAEGQDRAAVAVKNALNSPLLQENDIRGARYILLNITSGEKEVTMDEIFDITNYVQDEAGKGTDMIWGHGTDPALGDQICVTIIATGFEMKQQNQSLEGQMSKPEVKVVLGQEDSFIRNRPKILNTTPPSTQEEFIFEHQNDVDENRKVRKNEKDVESDFIRYRRNATVRTSSENLTQRVNWTNEEIQNLESEPAYIRRGCRLDDVDPAHKTMSSRISISDDDASALRQGNSFLHDSVD